MGPPMAHGEPHPDAGSTAVPLCVDLDGTLLRGDTLWESLLLLARQRPASLLAVPLWLAGGRAALKARMAGAVRLDPAALPYRDDVLEHLRFEHRAGRRLILVTAAHEVPAAAVAEHLGLFDEVVASTAAHNLKGAAKRAALVARFGERGFDYAGDSAADAPVWDAARRAILVDPSAAVRRRFGPHAERVFDSARRSRLGLLLSALRAHQWIKNLLVFVPAGLAHRWRDAAALGNSALAFVAFCLVASAVYLLNDLLDVEADRTHPVKRRRPLAAGELTVPAALLLALALCGGGLGLALLLPPAFGLVLAGYLLVTTAYSLALKEVAVLDVLLLAALYTARILGGSAASSVAVSEWLLAFSAFVFLSLGAIKRYGELRPLRLRDHRAQVLRRGYVAADLELLVPMGIASGYSAVLVLALYITSDAVTALYARRALLWPICGLVLYWISRIWLLAHRGEVEDDPLAFAVRDRATWVVAALCATLLVAASRAT